MTKPLFFKNPLEIIKEAAITDDIYKGEREVGEGLTNSILEAYNNAAIVPKEALKFKVQDVPVTAFKEGDYTRYLVDNNVIISFMEANEIKSVKDAFGAIAEANNIHTHDMRLVLESQDEIVDTLHRYQKQYMNNPTDMYATLKQGYEYFEDVCNSGITVMQKESKGMPQQDRDSLMIGGNAHSDITSTPYQNDDLSSQSMKGRGSNTNFFENELLNDDLKTQSMKGGSASSTIANKAFNNDDYVYGSMAGSKMGVRISDAPFTQDDDTDPMKGNAGSIKHDDSLFGNDDPNLNGMSTGHKGF